MTRTYPLILSCVLASCGPSASTPPNSPVGSSQALRPDSSVLDGVVRYTHAAGTFARAAQFTLDTVPITVYDGGTNGDFDLTDVRTPYLFPDGRLLASNWIGKGKLMLFSADGKPARVIAHWGEGPGDVRSPNSAFALAGDTALVVDGGTRRLNWVTADAGIVHTAPLVRGSVPPFCFLNAALLPGRRLLASSSCLLQGQIDKPTRPPVAVLVMGLDFSAPDTVAELPGFEMVPFETRYHGVKRIEARAIRFGEAARVAPWGSGFVSATGIGGYVLEQRTLDGHVVASIRVNEPRRVVTLEMRETKIRQELERINGPQEEGFVDIGETRRSARESPFADSLPAMGNLLVAPEDILWVTDFVLPSDSTWSATAFRPNGAMVGRLIVHMKGSTPVAFGKDRVLLRLVDDDGVVRFGVYRVVPFKK